MIPEMKTLDMVYSWIIGELSLSASHKKTLQRGGIKAETIHRCGYRTWPVVRTTRQKIATRLLDEFGDIVCSVPEFCPATENSGPTLDPLGGRGFIVPIRNQEGAIVGIVNRLEYPSKKRRFVVAPSADHCLIDLAEAQLEPRMEIATRQQADSHTLTVSEAASRLGISRNYYYKCAKEGKLPTIHVGQRLLVPIHAIEKIINSGGSMAETASPTTNPESPVRPQDNIIESPIIIPPNSKLTEEVARLKRVVEKITAKASSAEKIAAEEIDSLRKAITYLREVTLAGQCNQIDQLGKNVYDLTIAISNEQSEKRNREALLHSHIAYWRSNCIAAKNLLIASGVIPGQVEIVPSQGDQNAAL